MAAGGRRLARYGLLPQAPARSLSHCLLGHHRTISFQDIPLDDLHPKEVCQLGGGGVDALSNGKLCSIESAHGMPLLQIRTRMPAWLPELVDLPELNVRVI